MPIARRRLEVGDVVHYRDGIHPPRLDVIQTRPAVGLYAARAYRIRWTNVAWIEKVDR